MTRSPAFKCRSLSFKGHKNQRKIDNISNINGRLSNVNQPLSFDQKLERLDHKFVKHENSNLPSNGDVNANAKMEPKPIRSICSSLSSFVFPCKKAVKRKLNFDVDDGSDDVSSLRFSGKNISLCGFRSTTSSVADNRSLPDFYDATFSPNKRRRGVSNSYCRSSASSVVSCRRRLFVESEPPLKKTKLVSPVLCRRTNSKRKEIKLSLKKKFPGVPDSDSARGGLLLNLAFSKYNLSNTKKEDVKVDFVKGMTVSSATNKDFIHYSRIKQDESSLCRSPVFMAIKKVKRKLNLEDQETNIFDTQRTNGLKFVDSKASKSNDNLLLRNDVHLMNDDVPPQNDDTTLLSTAMNENLTGDIGEPSVLNANHDNFETTAFNGVNAPAAQRSANTIRCEANDKGIIAPISPTVVLPPHIRNESPPLSIKRIKPAKCFRHDLFKNSKLRSTLKNKIFDLSSINNRKREEIAKTNTSDKQLPLLDANDEKIDTSVTTEISTNRPENGDRTNESICYRGSTRNEKEYNKGNIVGKSPQKINTNNKTCRNTLNNRQSMKWFNRDSFIGENFVKGPRSRRESATTDCDQKFLKEHMNRFLTDCLVSVEQNREKDNFDNGKDEVRVDEANISEMLRSNAIDEISESQHAENSAKFDDIRINEVVIENVDSQCEIPAIENVSSQDEPIIIENVPSQDECHRVSDSCDDVDLLLSKSQDCSMYIMLKDILPGRTRKSNKCVNTDVEASSLHGQISPVLSDKPCISTRAETPKCMETRVSNDDLKMEQVSNDGLSYSCIEFTKPNEPKSTFDCNQELNSCDLLDTAKKTKRKKHAPNTLTQRLDKLLNREKSNFRMWEYEMSKTKIQLDDTDSQPALFCIHKMWKEYSSIILLCHFFRQDDSDVSFETEQITKLLDTEVSNEVIVILEPEYCPKNLTYSSVFQIHPPWKLLNFENCDPLVMLRPRKITVVKKDGNPVLYKDPSLPIVSTIKQQTICCRCEEYRCECLLPNGYRFFIESLVASDFSLFNPNSYNGLKHCEVDSFDSGCISDVVNKHKLFSCQHLRLDLRVLHLQKLVHEENTFLWYIICADKKKNICCVLCQGETNCIPSDVNEDVIFRFEGILPWKMIPRKNTAFFLQYVNYNNIPEDVNKMINSRSLVLFILSKKCGNVQRM